MLLLVMMLTMTAQTAWAQLFTTYPFKPTITYDGVNASDVTFSLTGGGVSNQALSNGQNFNVSIDDFHPTSFTITCSNPNGLDLQVNYSGKVYYGFSESNITFTTIDCYGSTFNLNNMKVYGNQYIAVTITVRANTSHDVNLPTGLTGGSITSNKSNPVTTAETVTLTAVPGSGYLPTSISATRHNGGAAVGVDWDGSFDNTATFAMPGDAVDVSASFTNVWTAAGGLFAKIPKNNATRSVTIPSGVTSFKVYGPSGSSAKTSYVNLEQGKLLLTAPDGCIIKLTGDILANGLFDIYVYDGNSTSSAKIGSYFGNTSGNEALPDNVVSTGNTMLITTMSEMNGLSAGLDLTAVVINTSGATTVTIIPAQEGGTVTADKTPAEYSFGETVTLSVTPDAGYLPGAISVTDESGNAVNVVGSSFTNSLTFTMPATNVTVTPTFTTTWTADGGLFANMPVTGSATVTIPNGVASFNVYDDGGLNRVVRPNCNGILTLTAPDGCKIRLTGDIYSEPGDVLSVYDGANISGTVLLNEFYSAFSYGSIGTHVSTGESMTLKFVTDAQNNNDGLRLISTVLYPVNVASSIEHGTVTADKAHAAAGETVTLDHHSEGYVFLGYTATGVTLSGSATSFTMPASDVTIGAEWADPADFSVNDAGTEFTIHTATGWGVFCDRLAAYGGKDFFSGKTVKLGADITVSRMAGSDHHDFCGTFDGDGHTLTFNYGTSGSYASDEYAAPFHYVSNVGSTAAAFRNLHVAGHIYTSAKYAAGLIAQHWGTVNVENCRVSTVIHSSVNGDGTHGGFEAVNIGVLNITGCVFDGKLLTTNGTDNCGGFVGWHNGGTTNISNSLYAPAAIATGEREAGPGTAGQNPSATFGRNAVNSIANSYYTRTLGTAQGKQAHSITASGNATLVHAGVATEYSVSGITAYKSGDDFTSGILYDNVLYAGSGDAVSLTLGNSATPTADAPAGYQYGDYSVSGGATLSGSTLTMADEDVTVSFTPGDQLRSTGQAVSVSYIDADGQPASHNAIALDGTETTLGQNNQETWYFVGADISYGDEIDCYGIVNIILADGYTMTVNSGSNGIYGSNGTLTIYGQTLGTGTLNATGTYYGIFHYSGSVVICGGTVNATATNGIGIYTDGIVTINGGTVNATGNNNDGIVAYGDVTITGGKVTVTGNNDDGIVAYEGNITLGCTNASDFIKATSYSPGFDKSVNIASGQTLFDEDGNEYSGDDVFIPYGKTLRPYDCRLALSDDADNTAAIAAANGKVYNVTLQGRTLYKDGAWNTLCLPFAVSTASGTLSGDGVQAMTLNTSSSSLADGTLTLNFDDATGQTIPAGTPFIIKWDNTGVNIENPVFEGVTVSNATNDATVTNVLTFTGTYAPVPIPATGDNTKLYLGNANKLYYPNAAMTIGTHRAYFQLLGDLTAGEPTSPQQASVRAFNLNFGDDEATGIISVHDSGFMVNGSDAWYTLDGRKLNKKPTKKGLYIHNGRKTVIK